MQRCPSLDPSRSPSKYLWAPGKTRWFSYRNLGFPRSRQCDRGHSSLVRVILAQSERGTNNVSLSCTASKLSG